MALIPLLVTEVGFSQTTTVKETITAKEKEIYQAIKNEDIDIFKSYTSDNLISVYRSGYATKDDEIDHLAEITIHSYQLSDIKVKQPAKDVAIIIYTLDASGIYQDKKFGGKFYAASTWIKSDGTWKTVMHTEIPAPVPEAHNMKGEMQ